MDNMNISEMNKISGSTPAVKFDNVAVSPFPFADIANTPLPQANVNIPDSIPSNVIASAQPKDITNTISTFQFPYNTAQGALTSTIDTLSAVKPPEEPKPVELSPREKMLQQAREGLDKYFNPETGYQARSSQLQQELQPKIQELNALEVKDIALQKQLKDFENQVLNKNTQGLFGGAGQQSINQFSRDISSQRADIAIQKLALQGDIAGATEMIKLKLNAEFEPIKQRLDYISKILELENNDLTEKQKLQLQTEADTLKAKEAGLKDFQKSLTEAQINGASIETLKQAEALYKAGDTRGAISLIAGNLSGGTGTYNQTQNKVISSIDSAISKNATYVKTSNMRGYADNVIASLSQGTGTGDLAAINQFQKVIDEGAVTRDQDVKLIQDSQSLVNKLKTYAKKLEKGEQLSPALRSEMKLAVETLYTKQIEALAKDPFINAKKMELERYQIDPNDTIIGELGAYSSPQSNTSGEVQTTIINGKVLPISF